LSRTEPHDEFLELCAVSTSGQLTAEEQKKLNEHLLVCRSCREALREYQFVVDEAIPAIAANQDIASESDPSWSEGDVERVLFQRLAKEERAEPIKAYSRKHPSFALHQIPSLPNEPSWPYVWLLYAAGVVLFLSLGFYAYRIQRQQSLSNSAQRTATPLAPADQSFLEQQLSDAAHDREIARTDIEQRDKLVADLRRRLAQQASEVTRLRTAQEQLQAELRTSDADREELAQRQTELAHKLESAESHSTMLQSKMDSLTQQSAQDAARAKSLEARTSDLTRLLQDREATVDQQQQLLSHDRDIRELMGARDLYIAEVYDVARTGETKKPFGRVFYTRGKSLIFYAYDLDQQPEVKNAMTFQAWGRRGQDRKQALNLGVFYQDSVSKKRWVLKCDDPRTLAQIDGVFVTLEPNGGSHTPSGKSLLFASLRIDPNHP
jgi:hypothetical protein